jgi:hypothetical protein
MRHAGFVDDVQRVVHLIRCRVPSPVADNFHAVQDACDAFH